jgi:FkbM family methyltransferase
MLTPRLGQQRLLGGGFRGMVMGASTRSTKGRSLALLRKIAGCAPISLPIAGRKRDLVFRLLDPPFRSIGKETHIVTPHGTLSLDWSHAPERLLAYVFDNVFRYYDRSELGRYIERIAEPGTTFVDVGANLGMYALVARHYGFNTIAVEPEPRHAAFLERNAAVYGKVLSVALSDEPGALPLYFDAANPGATSLFADPSYAKSENVVPVRTFTDLAAQGEFGDTKLLRLIKIDVEGFETNVIAGMEGLFASGVRPHVWCEVRGDLSPRNGGSFRHVCRILSSYGYQFSELRNGRSSTPELQGFAERGYFDLLFSPSE